MAVDGRDPYRRVPRELYCEFERTLKGECCLEKGCVELEGLWLCERHVYRLWLEERVAFWRAMLAHTELWSGEARRRGRDDVVGRRIIGLVVHAHDLEDLEESRDLDGENGSGVGRDPPNGDRYS